MPTPQSPAAGVFGYEVADDIAKNKNLLQQIVQALGANGVTVTLPGTFQTPDVSNGKGGTPLDQERILLANIVTAVAAVKSALVLSSAAPVALLRIAALASGAAGSGITVTVAAGSVSGKKITITPAVGSPEVYDNLASVAAAVTAIHGVSAFVDAIFIAEGTLATLSATHLAGGVSYTPPSVGFGQPGTLDGSSVEIDKWAAAIFTGLQSAGYLN